jgi:hypothetical protein
MQSHKKLIRAKSIEDILLLFVEVNTYKWSQQIANFNYDENHQILTQICTYRLNETDIVNILYVTSLIELLGSKYITFAIILHKNKFLTANKEFAETIAKYIDWQTHSAASYTIMMRKAAMIIEYKYKLDDISLLTISQEQKIKKK